MESSVPQSEWSSSNARFPLSWPEPSPVSTVTQQLRRLSGETLATVPAQPHPPETVTIHSKSVLWSLREGQRPDLPASTPFSGPTLRSLRASQKLPRG